MKVEEQYTNDRNNIIEANLGHTMEDLYDDAYSQAKKDVLAEIDEIYKQIETYNYEAKRAMEIREKDHNLNLKNPDPLLIDLMMNLGQHQAYEHTLKVLKRKFKI